jgi:hypothetical protein
VLQRLLPLLRPFGVFNLPFLLLLAWCSCTVCFIFCVLVLLCIIAMLLLLCAALQVPHCCYRDAAAWHW